MFTYRESTKSDLEWIVDYKKKMFIEFGRGDLLAKNFESIVIKDYESLYRKDLAKHFVCEVNDKPVAIVGAFIKSDLPFRYFVFSSYGFIGDVYTCQDQRGNGLASTLNNQAIDWLKSKGVSYVRLLASDAGRPIYEKLGFKPTEDMELIL